MGKSAEEKKTKKFRKVESKFIDYYKNKKVSQNQILFEIHKGNESSSFCFLNTFLKCEESQNYTIFLSFDNIKESKKIVDKYNYNFKCLEIDTCEYAKALATSKYLINDKYFPDYFICKDEQVYLKIWNKTPIMSLEEEVKYHLNSVFKQQHDFIQASYIIFPNEYTKNVIVKDYNLKELYTGKIIVGGKLINEDYSNDSLKDNNHEKIAYIPDWKSRYRYGLQSSDIDYLNNMFDILNNHLNNKKMYVYVEPFIQRHIDFNKYENISSFTDDFSLYDILNSMDLLITDLSDIMFDFSLTNKPIVLFLYDYENYINDKALYFDINKINFEKVYSLEDLCSLLDSNDYINNTYINDKEFFNNFIKGNNKDNLIKIINHIFTNTKINFKIEDFSQNKKKEQKAIYPFKINNEDMINTLYNVAKESNNIVLIRERFINPYLANYLYSQYKNNFKYIFVSDRQISSALKKGNNKLDKVDGKNVFGNLNVDLNLVKNYYHGVVGEKYNVGLDPNEIGVSISTQKNNLIIKLNTNKHINKFLIVKNEKIIYTKKISNDYGTKNQIIINFNNLLNDEIINLGGKYRIVIETTDNSGNKHINFLLDSKKFNQADKSSSNYYYYYNPIFYDINELNEEIVILPYLSNVKGYLSFAVEFASKFANRLFKCKVNKFSADKTILKLNLKLDKENNKVRGVYFKYRSSTDNIYYSMHNNVIDKGKYWDIDAEIDLKDKELKEKQWDVVVLVETNGKKSFVKVKFNDSLISRIKSFIRFYFLSTNLKFNNGFNLYPYKTKNGNLAYTYSDQTKKQYIKKKIRTYLRKRIRKIIYSTYHALYNYVSVDNKTVIFISFHGRGYSDNPKAIFEAMRDDPQFKDYHFIWFIKNHKSKDIEIEGADIKEYYSIPYFYYMSKAKYWIANCKLPRYLVKKDEQIYLQTWHGTPLKRLAHDIIVPEGTKFYRSGMSFNSMVNTYDVDVARYNYMISPNKFCTDVFQTSFAIDKDRLIETGYPRNDFITNATKQDIVNIKNKYHIPLDKKVILYAPTWRDNSYVASGYTFELEADFHKWKKVLGDDYVVVFKPHYLIINKYENDESLDGFLYSIDANAEINELYVISDILITDYSSVFFDYAVLNRPIYFYMYDLESYKNELRGFYLDIYTELPGKIYEKENKMLNDIKQKEYDYDLLLKFNKRFNHAQTGDCANKVIDIIFDKDY